MPNSGELRWPAVVQEAVETQDSMGELDVTWRDVAAIRVKIEELRGSEYFSAQQTGASRAIRIWSRWLDGVRPKMRLQVTDEGQERIFEIESAIKTRLQARWWLELMCYEVI